MTNRELSEKLYELGSKLEQIAEGDHTRSDSKRILFEIADELHALSNEKYTPGHTSWADLKGQVPKKPNQPSKTMKYTNKTGRQLPF